MQRPVVVLTGQRRPHELLLFAVGIVSAVGYAVGGPAPGSVAAVLPWWAVAGFYLLFFVGSVLGLVGCLIHRTEVGPGLEQGGLLIQAAGLAVYMVVVPVYAGSRGWGQVVILAGWLAANLWRAAQIQADLRAVRRAGSR